MCDAGLGGCLADDMGLGKTIQVIALHLHRREAKAGPTLVVCPASLLGTWEREVRRFAPGVPVRRYHGGGRHLQELADDEIVLVTYGVVVRDSAELADVHRGRRLGIADQGRALQLRQELADPRVGRLLVVQPGQQPHLIAPILDPSTGHVRLLVPAQE